MCYYSDTKDQDTMKKLEILPTTLYEFEAPDEIHFNIVNFVETLNWEGVSNRCDKPYYGKSTNCIRKDEKIRDFVTWQNAQINQVGKELKCVFCDSFTPVSMWANKSTTNEWHHRHHHSWSFLSCIYFVSGESGDTWFSRESEYHSKNMKLQDDADTEICYIHKVKPKTLIVFPSKLEHSVSENFSETPRISISTNYLPQGQVGMGMGYTTSLPNFS